MAQRTEGQDRENRLGVQAGAGISCCDSVLMMFQMIRDSSRAAFRGLLMLLLGCMAVGCDSAPKAAVEVAQPGIVVPTVVKQARGQELLQLSQPIPGMTLSAVRELELPGILTTTGQIAYDDKHVASIISRVAGRIERVYASQWDYVRRGQPIVTLYSPDFMTTEAEYLQARQSESALGGGGASDREFARSMVEAARRKLDLLGIEPAQIAAINSAAPSFTMGAPISGTIVQSQAVRGASVNPGDVLYSLGTLNYVWVLGDLYEDNLARVHVGQPLEAVTMAYPGEVFRGEVERISPNVDPNTHTLQVRCRIENPDLRLKPQMLATVQITVQRGEAVIVPLDALVFETDNYFAYLDAGGGRLERRRVFITSWNQDGYARVRGGLQPGERVVTGATMLVNELWHEAHGERS
jgi:membrane fusion protein, copper/silver efflux system